MNSVLRTVALAFVLLNQLLPAENVTIPASPAEGYDQKLQRVRRRMETFPAFRAASASSLVQPVVLPTVYGTNPGRAAAQFQRELLRTGLQIKNVFFAEKYWIPAGPGSAAAFAISAMAFARPPQAAASCEATAQTGQTLDDQTDQVFATLQACLDRKQLLLTDVVRSSVFFDRDGDGVTLRMIWVAARFEPATSPTRATRY